MPFSLSNHLLERQRRRAASRPPAPEENETVEVSKREGPESPSRPPLTKAGNRTPARAKPTAQPTGVENPKALVKEIAREVVGTIREVVKSEMASQRKGQEIPKSNAARDRKDSVETNVSGTQAVPLDDIAGFIDQLNKNKVDSRSR